MSSSIRHITIDSADPYSLGSFWSGVLGTPLADDDEPGDPAALLVHDHGPPLLFVTVNDPKVVKNRVHLDIQPRDRTRDAEVTRLIELGATMVADRRRADGSGWVTLADPEGNEFCVERSHGERSD